MEKEKVLCLICCLSYESRQTEEEKNGRTVEIIKTVAQFDEEILSEWRPPPEQQDHQSALNEKIPKKSRKGRRKKRKLELEEVLEKMETAVADARVQAEGGDANVPVGGGMECKITALLESCQPDNISICQDCTANMKNAMEARAQASEVERHVRKLQLLLLKGLRSLHRQMDRFYVEMEKIEIDLSSADISCLDAVLSFSGTKKSKLLKPVFGKAPVNKFTLRRERVLRFRNQLLEASSDLQKYRLEIDEKLYLGRTDRMEVEEKDLNKLIGKVEPEDSCSSPVEVEIKQEMEVEDENYDDMPHSFDDEVVDEGAVIEGDYDGVDFNLENEFFSEASKPKSETATSTLTRKKALKRKEQKRKQKADQNVNYEDEAEETDPDDRNYEMEDSSESDFDDESDDDYNPLKGRKIKGRKQLSFYGERTSGMFFAEDFLKDLPDFKSRFVKRVLKKQDANFKCLQREGKNEKYRTPYQKQLLHLEYQPEQKMILLNEVPIHVLDKEENPELEEHCLECSKCAFKVVEEDDEKQMDYKMYDHVISKHLGGYPCSNCESILETQLDHRKHIKNCKEPKVDCDVCGRTLCHKRALERHRFLHMNEEEKNEALGKGLRIKPYQKDKERRFQCQSCGKAFRSPAEVRSHEQSHKSREERGEYMCTKCGKSFLKSGLEYHEKYSDCAVNPKPAGVKCSTCEKVYKNKIVLANHIKLMHSDESEMRKFVCEECGKGFKTNVNLKLHKIIHTGLKPFPCKGCGTAFNCHRNMRRHEKNCKMAQAGEGGSVPGNVEGGVFNQQNQDQVQQNAQLSFNEYFANTL